MLLKPVYLELNFMKTLVSITLIYLINGGFIFVYINILTGLWIEKVKLATVVEGEQKAPFSIASSPKCRRGSYSIPWIEPMSPGPVANTQPTNRHSGLVGRLFTNWPGDLDSIPGHIIAKTIKWYLIPPCLTLSNIKYVSRVNWSNPGKGVVPSLTHYVVAIEKGALWLPSSKVANLT